MKDETNITQAEWVVRASNFTQFVGLRITHLERGLCHSVLPSRAELLNQGGVIHGGLYAVVADHTAGVAASTVVPEGMRVVTAEYKLNLLRPGDCDKLLTTGRVIKEGKRLIIGEAEVYGGKDNKESNNDNNGNNNNDNKESNNDNNENQQLLAKALFTFAVIPKQ